MYNDASTYTNNSDIDTSRYSIGTTAIGNDDGSTNSQADLVCLSHLRWGFVYQRPQHLLSRWARDHRVFFVEEPIFGEGDAHMKIENDPNSGVQFVTPFLPHGMNGEEIEKKLENLLENFFAESGIRDYFLWYYTPMALGFTRNLQPLAIVYDCMDELSAFKGAPPALLDRESELFDRADVVFTGGASLYEAKQDRHPNIHPFPSSVDAAHFMQARNPIEEPADQASIPHPRIGFFGVLDERLDIELLRGAAELRPDYHFVMIGPVVKIDPADLPKRDNIHYLNGKDYKELPAYLAGWDVAMMPFARNESTKFISPTKTPEYLAAGRPVVSTSIRDVVRPYGEMDMVRIADTPEEFASAIDHFLSEQHDAAEWMERVDAYLSGLSWNRTWQHMKNLVDAAIGARRQTATN